MLLRPSFPLTPLLPFPQVGVWFLWPVSSPSSRPSSPPTARSLLLRLLATTALLWLAALSSSQLLLQPVSRRLCNLPYVLWAAAHNVLVLLLLLAVDLFASIPAKSQVPLTPRKKRRWNRYSCPRPFVYVCERPMPFVHVVILSA